MRLNKRAVIYVTSVCNQKCKFCYYAYHSGQRSHTPLIGIKRRLDIYRFKYNLTHIDITGMGEPTLHPEIREIVKYCDEIDLKPTIITNGQRPDIMEQLIEDGYLEDVVLSIHSVGEDFNELTKGDWNKSLETMKLLKEKNFYWRGNVCVVKDNLKHLVETINITKRYGGRLMNFLVFNPHGHTELASKENECQATYTECAEAIKPAIDRANEVGVMIEVRYIPICTMKGYEKYVMNFHQWIFDPYGWEEAHGNARPPFNNNQEAIDFVAQKTKENYKEGNCENCSFKKYCDGIYPQYQKKYGVKEFKPFTEPVDHAMHWRIKYMEEHPEAYSDDKW